jgi:hypothetical protein
VASDEERVMEYGLKGAWKYILVGLRLLVVSAAQRFGFRCYEMDDGTALRAFALSLAFEPTRRTRAPVAGWSCEHMAITAGNGLIRDPAFGCGCTPAPILASAT